MRFVLAVVAAECRARACKTQPVQVQSSVQRAIQATLIHAVEDEAIAPLRVCTGSSRHYE